MLEMYERQIYIWLLQQQVMKHFFANMSINVTWLQALRNKCPLAASLHASQVIEKLLLWKSAGSIKFSLTNFKNLTLSDASQPLLIVFTVKD